jgi:thioredoxin-dependent peroxiredoxin
MSEKRIVTMKGAELGLSGKQLKIGQAAPDFHLLTNDLSIVSLESYKGKTLLISAVPSLDTPVCDTETRKFNATSTTLDKDALILTVSMDLPFAQKRWCGMAGIERVITLSDHRDANFGLSYGILIERLRLLARAIFLVDRDGILRYTQLVSEITHEPDYEGALNALKAIR